MSIHSLDYPRRPPYSHPESFGFWQIVLVQREEIEFFCPTKEVAFAARHDEFDLETGFPRTTATGQPTN